MHAIVVGGGIGGLATALGLGRAGWRVTLLERQPELTAAGAGLLIWPNAVHALRALGVGAEIENAGVPNAGRGGMRRPDGTWLSKIDSLAIAASLGSPPITMHRVDLHRILVAALPPNVEVRAGVEATAVPEGSDLVVAADGIHSALRQRLFPATRVRDTGQVAWRAVASGTFDLSAGAGETVGRGWRFGLAPVGSPAGAAQRSPRSSDPASQPAPIGDAGVYWYASATGPLRTTSPGEQLAELRARFAGWHDPIPALLAATSPEQLLHHPLADLDPLPPMRFGDRVALVGDAAHAMTPNLGQGAAQALEDAVTLVAEVAGGDIAGGLVRYDAVRRPRVAGIVRNSRRAGDVLGAGGRLTAALRDLAVRAVPDRVLQASAIRTASWRPPADLLVADRP
jgi:2-polyprenyl-6-methoxyphenol hydroxylase-like FAD-dependent oxidoreductase